MKTFLSVNVCLILTFSCLGQKNEKMRIEGEFGTYLQGQIVYYQQKMDEGSEEAPLYDIKLFDLKVHTTKSLASKIRYPKVILFNRNELMYITEHNIIFSIMGKVQSIYTTKGNLIDLEYERIQHLLSFIEVNPELTLAKVCIMDFKTKKILFEEEISLNQMELEGLDVISHWVNNSFVFSLQAKLYQISMTKYPKLFHISDKLYTYAIYRDDLILYEFISDDMTQGYLYNIGTKSKQKNIEIQKIQDIIENCVQNRLYTSQQDSIYLPLYEICKKSFVYNKTWIPQQKSVLFSNNKIIISLDTATPSYFFIECK
jgi:hypothetical protein